MTTTTDTLHFHNLFIEVTAGTATTTPTTTTTAPISAEHPTGAAETSGIKADAPSAAQIEDLNYYLKRISIGKSEDISQIESFGGGSDYEMFLDAICSVGIRHGWSEAEILRTVEMKLKDKAREYYGALLPTERPTSMPAMKQWFRRIFGRKLSITAGKRELKRCIRIPGEPLGEYAQRLKVIANKMFPINALTTTEKLYHRNLLLVNQFIEGLDRRLANEILRAGEFYNLDDCLEVAEECEEIVSRMLPETRQDFIRRIETHQENGGRTQQETMRYGGRGNSRGTRQAYQRRPHGNGSRGRHNNRNGRRNTGVRRVDNRMKFEGGIQRKYPYMKNRCTRCGQQGHFSVGCLNPRKVFCFHCGKVGEICDFNSQRPRI